MLDIDYRGGEEPPRAREFSRALHGHFGCTRSAYVRPLRLEWAMRQLVHTNRHVSAIAANAHFKRSCAFLARVGAPLV